MIRAPVKLQYYGCGENKRMLSERAELKPTDAS